MNGIGTSMIVAVANNNIIGNKGDLPWHLPPDLKYFKEVTTGKTVVMGRKCYESIGKPLPNRKNVILTRDVNFAAPCCTIINNPEDIDLTDAFIIGGSEVYNLYLDKCDYLYLTRIFEHFQGDTFLNLDMTNWEPYKISGLKEYGDIKYRFEVYRKS